MEETQQNAPSVRVRDNNTVRAIIASIVQFLLWIQDEIVVGFRLIGITPEFRIRLTERIIYDHRRNKHIVQLIYHLLPPKDIKEPKRPISRDKRLALWTAISAMSAKAVNQPRWTGDRELCSVINIYLKERRALLLDLLEATGARPGELARLSVSKNEDCDKSNSLVLLTLKRRRQQERTIPLPPSIAMRLTVFIKKHRRTLLNAIKFSANSIAPLDRVFLSINGTPTTERVMESDFSRISKAAGLGNFQCCMSMFRHRYITIQVAIHLGFYLHAENKAREIMTESDYRTILKKVATITGHANELSLLHYIDLAWDELGFGDKVDTIIATQASIESTTNQITLIIAQLDQQNIKKPTELLKTTKESLINIKNQLTKTTTSNKNNPKTS